jgi:CBS domain-containing protein
MTKKVISVGPATPVKDVVARLVRFAVSSLPVLDDDGVLVGIVTEADVIAKPAFGARRPRLAVLLDLLSTKGHVWAATAAGMTAGELMTPDPLVCQPDDDVAAVARLMLERGVRCLPVMAGELVGVVTRRDILAMYDRSDEAILADIVTLTLPDEAEVAVTVVDGVVAVHGSVACPEDSSEVVAEINRVRGVIAVVDHLHCAPARPATRAR